MIRWRKASVQIGIGMAMAMVMGCQESSMKHKTSMKVSSVAFEHIGLNLPDPKAAAEWYCKNLGMTVVKNPPGQNVFFVADSGRHMMLELYHNPKSPVPDYVSIEHLSLHISFMVDNLEVVRTRLIAAGARPMGDIASSASGDKVANFRDPWGLPIQFVQRAEPMLPHHP
jgi:catechol 2,3-dioxygenase-like lactoylglutathione lyase family enzyme